MSFMDSYKRLDNLCKTFPDYPKGISSYIEVMECSNQIRYRCMGWSSYYDRLKKYRYIRNQIAHDNGVYEDDLCTIEDEQWLQNFQTRLLNSNDPLALYFKSQRVSATYSKQATQMPTQQPTPPRQPTTTSSAKRPIGCAICFALAMMATVAVLWLMLRV